MRPFKIRSFAALPEAIRAKLAAPSYTPEQSIGTGAPVAAKVLREALSFIPADTDRDEWRDVIFALQDAIISDETGDEIRCELAHEYSRGELDREGKYKDALPSKYYGAGSGCRDFCKQ